MRLYAFSFFIKKFLFFFVFFGHIITSHHIITSTSSQCVFTDLLLVGHPQLFKLFFFIVRRRDDLMVQVIPNANQLMCEIVIDVVIFRAKVSLSTVRE